MTIPRLSSVAIVLAGCACLSGCATPSPPEPETNAPLTGTEIQAFYRRAQDPRRFFLTVYDSDDGPVFSGDFRAHPNQQCVLPFTSPRGSPVPVVAFRGRSPDTFRALVDTSASEVWAGLPAAVAMGLTPLNNPAYRLFPTHVKDEVPGLLCAGEKFRFNQVQLETPLVFARAAHGSLGPLQRGQADAQFTFGMRCLGGFRTVQFDFVRRELVLATDQAFTPDPASLVATVPYSLRLGALSVEGTVNGEPATFILDTAGMFGLVRANPDGAPLRHVSLGGLVFRELTPEDHATHGLGMTDIPRIGLDLLVRFRVTLDTQKRLVHFEKPAP